MKKLLLFLFLFRLGGSVVLEGSSRRSPCCNSPQRSPSLDKDAIKRIIEEAKQAIDVAKNKLDKAVVALSVTDEDERREA